MNGPALLIGALGDRNRTGSREMPGLGLPVCVPGPTGQNGQGAASERDRDGRLVLRVQEGDLSAFEELVENYKRRLVNYATYALHDPIEAQDIAQKAFLQVYRSIRSFRFTAKFSTWLFAVTRNLCLNELRRRARHPAEPLEDHYVDHDCLVAAISVHEPNVWESVLETELQNLLEQALAILPERQRTALLLLRDQDLSYEDIAAVLGTTLPATKSLIHHGRKRLKWMLGQYLGRVAAQVERKTEDRGPTTACGPRTMPNVCHRDRGGCIIIRSEPCEDHEPHAKRE